MKYGFFGRFCLLPLITLALSAPLSADTQFISDVCYVSLRAEQNNQSKVVFSGLKTGNVVTLLEAPEESDWSKVRTESGKEGWLRRQYLTSNPTAQMQLERLVASQTANKHPAAVDPMAGVPAACQSYASELSSLKALSADAVNLNKRYQDLLAEHELAKTKLDGLRAENERLKDSHRYTQWIFGGGLVALGILLTLIIQAIKPKARTEWI